LTDYESEVIMDMSFQLLKQLIWKGFRLTGGYYENRSSNGMW